MRVAEDLRTTAAWIGALAEQGAQPDLERPLSALRDAAERVGLAWRGSWLTGLANLYESGLAESVPGRCTEWAADQVHDAVHKMSGNPDMPWLIATARDATNRFEDARICVKALLSAVCSTHVRDAQLNRLVAEFDTIRVADAVSVIETWRPKMRVIGRDRAPPEADPAIPAHFSELAVVLALRSPYEAAAALAAWTQRLAQYLEQLPHEQQPDVRHDRIASARWRDPGARATALTMPR